MRKKRRWSYHRHRLNSYNRRVALLLGDLKVSPQPEFSWRDNSKTAPGAGYLKAALILPTGKVARADLIFHESCDLTTGTTRTFSATSSIQREMSTPTAAAII